MIKGFSLEEVKNLEVESENSNSKKGTWIPTLTGLSNIGDKVFVQFVGIKGLSDLVSYKCHTVHIKSKKGNEIPMQVPCLDADGKNPDACPLCKCSFEGQTVYKNGHTADWKEKETSLVMPLLMFNLNMKFDSDKGEYVAKKEPKNVDGVSTLVEIGPQLVQRLNTSKRFRMALEKFVAQVGSLENKVVCIEVVRYKDQNGKDSNKGGAFDNDYSFAICNDLKSVDITQYDIPAEYPCVPVVALTEKTYEEMDRYINTHSFFEKKNGGSNEEQVTPRNETPDLPEDGPTEEGLDELPNVNMMRRN